MSERKISDGPILTDDLGQLVPPDFTLEKYSPDPKKITRRTSLKAREISMKTLREAGLLKE